MPSSGPQNHFDALLVVSFGGPEGPEDVEPFLHNVVKHRNVSPGRLAQVAEQYQRFGGISPINEQNRRLANRLAESLASAGRDLPVYIGNRNWHPYLHETLCRMRDDGIRHAAAFVTSAYSSYSSCRQYLEDIAAARTKVGTGAPEVLKLRPFFGHPGFIEPLAEGLAGALSQYPGAAVVMTAHSIPRTMAAACEYERQLHQVAALISTTIARGQDAQSAASSPGEDAVPGPGWKLAFQSRSGPPDQPWLEPDVNAVIEALPPGTPAVVVVPIGFVSEHLEVLHDLDVVAAQTARRRGMEFTRVPTPASDPRFVAMVLDLLAEAENPRQPVPWLGESSKPPWPCEPGCCPLRVS